MHQNIYVDYLQHSVVKYFKEILNFRKERQLNRFYGWIGFYGSVFTEHYSITIEAKYPGFYV